MGIKFNIFYDRILLAETSNFAKFFTSRKPIQIIHDILKISHNAELKLSPTNNRHVLWDALREGNALFVSINRPKSINDAKENLRIQIRDLSNEIKTICEQAINMVRGESVDSFTYKKIKNRLIGPRISGKKSVLDVVKEIYPNKNSLLDAINKFVESIKPGNYILIKRVAMDIGTSWATPFTSPDDRRFPVRPETDKSAKVFGQDYIAWRFDGDRLIEKKRILENAVTAFNLYFKGWGDRDFYIIEDKSFQKILRHPFVSQREMRFEKILPIDTTSIESFVDINIQRFKKLIIKEIEITSAQLDKHVSSIIKKPDELSNEDIRDIREYKETLKYLNQDVLKPDALSLFNKFVRYDINLDLNDYIIIDTYESSFKSIDPYYPDFIEDDNIQRRGDAWKILNKQQKQKGIEKIKQGVMINKPSEIVKIRPKIDRKNIQNVHFNDFIRLARNDINRYEMFDANFNRWVPVDPNYIEKYGKMPNVAIAFENSKSYNDFVRKFILFVLHNMVKRPSIKKFDALLRKVNF
jgi:hypothetical protein